MRCLRYRARRPRPHIPRRTFVASSEAPKAIQASPTLPNRESQVRTYDREKTLCRHEPQPRVPQLGRRGLVRPYIEARRLYAGGRALGRRSNEPRRGCVLQRQGRRPRSSRSARQPGTLMMLEGTPRLKSRSVGGKAGRDGCADCL